MTFRDVLALLGYWRSLPYDTSLLRHIKIAIETRARLAEEGLL